MPRFEFSQDDPPADWVARSSRLLGLLVRGCGLVLLLVGFAVALMVIASAWSLYQEPARIEAFARAVERGSNLDLTLSRATSAARAELEVPAPGSAAAQPASVAAQPAFRFSYFIAWVLVILLLLLIGRLSIAAVRTGGELVLYDAARRRGAAS